MRSISTKNQTNWLLDSTLAISGIIVGLSSIYFLFLPLDGYRGGRNPYYGITVLFDRHTWSDLHNWVGVALTLIAAIHLILHFDWVVAMAKRVARETIGRKAVLNARGRFNVFVDAMIALGFLVSAVSGLIFFLFIGEGNLFTVAGDVLFTKTTWNLIHTWSGILMIAAAVVHFAIHWQWVVKITRRMFERYSNPIPADTLASVES
jgi:hypothetical protein